MKLYHVWFVDTDGNEDTLLFCAEPKDKDTIEEHMRERKIKGMNGDYGAGVSDYVVTEADIHSVAGVLDYVKEKLEQ